MKPHERALADALLAFPPGHIPSVNIRAVIARQPIPEKQSLAILKKWERKGWWEYGGHLVIGAGFTPEGRAALAAEL